MIRRLGTPTKKRRNKLAKYSDVNSRFKTMREFLFKDDFGQQIFPSKKKGFYYAHVTLDWLEIKQTPPDVFSMAYETGLNMVGIGVALDTYTQMLNSGQWSYYLPHYYYTWYCPAKYKKQQKITFEALSTLVGLIAEDMYMAGYEISRAGGGLGVYIPMILDQLESVSEAEVQSLKIMNTLNKSKEFYFIEYALHDPTYGTLMFNNATFAESNNKFTFTGNFENVYNDKKHCYEEKLKSFTDDAGKFFDINWNIFNPQRFEQWLKPFVTKIYDSTTPLTTIYKECKLDRKKTVLDTLKIAWSDSTVNNVAYTFYMSNRRELSSMVLTYENRPLYDVTGAPIRQYWVISGDAQMEQFFRAGSWFLIQPLITNFLYSQYLIETEREKVLLKQLQPPRIRTVEEWENFTGYYVQHMSYGKPLSSTVGSWMQKNLKNLGGSGGLRGSFDSCSH